MARLDRATQPARVGAPTTFRDTPDKSLRRLNRKLIHCRSQAGRDVQTRTYWVYILASKRNGTLYVGVTNDLLRRVSEHRDGSVPGFTKKYGVKHLVYFEEFDDIRAAIHRETRLKKWNRKWKLGLIESRNPDWTDLYEEIMAPQPLPEWLLIANAKASQRYS